MDVRCRNSKTGEERIFPQKVYEAVEEDYTFICQEPDPEECDRKGIPYPKVAEGSDLPQGQAQVFYSPSDNQAQNQAMIEELLRLREENQALKESKEPAKRGRPVKNQE